MATNTTPDAKKLLTAIGNACGVYTGADMDIDGCDTEPTEGPDGAFSMEMTKFVEEPKAAGHRGPGGGKPLGIIKYTVTVVGKWEPFDDE